MLDETFSMIPFMDTFYSLSSNDHQERNIAGSSLLHHVFVSIDDDSKSNDKTDEEKYQNRFDALIKDGCYAFTRLLNGLCSGRASARQGYASCLSSFLKLSFQLSPPKDLYPDGCCWMEHFMQHMEKSENQNLTPLEFVRKQLLKHTSSEALAVSGGKGHSKREKKGSEVRDHVFGALFGILAVARSGILKGTSGTSFENLKGYVLDLLGLYHLKWWMQESAIHALKELFALASSDGDLETISKLLDDDQFSSFFAPQCSWTASKVALYLHLQAIFLSRKDVNDSEDLLPNVLKTPVLTVSSLQKGGSNCDMNSILKGTAVIVHPRCHVVWESIWSYLCEKSDSIEKKKIMVLRSKIALGGDAPADIVKGLVDKLIVQSLLGDSESNHNITHERCSLAMTLISKLCEIQLPPDFLEKVILHPKIVEKLFIQTLKTRTKPGDKNHTLKPLAHKILQYIVRSLDSQENNIERRLAVARSLIHAHPSFDKVTQTQTVSALLCLNSVHQGNNNNTSLTSFHHKLWEQYFDFLRKELYVNCTDNRDEQGAKKYVDLIFNFTKQVSHVGNEEHRQYFFRRVSLVLIVGSFFNLDKLVSESSKSDEDTKSVWSTVKSIQKHIEENKTPLPHRIRVMMSSKFLSLLSDFVANDSRAKSRRAKVELVTTEISHIQSLIKTIEGFGATFINRGNIINDKDNDIHGLFPFESSLQICCNIKQMISKEVLKKNEMKFPVVSAILGLICSLSLQLLHPGQPNNIDESDGDEIDEVFDEVHEMLTDLADVAIGLCNQICKNESDEDEEVDPLCSFAATCVNILNSPIGGSTLNNSIHLNGGSRLVRDSIQSAWGAILVALSGESSGLESILNEEVIGLLLESICFEEVFSDPTICDQDSEMEEADSSEYDEKSQEEGFSAFTEANATGIDLENMEIDDSESKDEEVDIELDPSSLENLLLEDRDIVGSDEETALEHHAGADGALAQLIKLKQEASKAGQNKREKNDLSNRVRCFPLLEAVFATRKHKSVPDQITLMTILPLLRTRTILLKSLISSENSLSQKSTSCIADKRALMDRITSFLANKICKANFTEKTNFDACQTLSKQLMIELKSVSDIDHCKLCSSLLLLVVKSIGADELEASCTLSKPIYIDAVQEWSQKRNSKLQCLVFDDLISAYPSVAKFSLLSELIKASTEARSSYHKSESFRMISELFHITKHDSLEVKSVLQENSATLCSSIEAALGDNGMVKAKRVGEVLKATEKLTDFSSSHSSDKNDISKLITPLQTLANTTASDKVKFYCEKLLKSVKEVEQKANLAFTVNTNEKSIGSGTSSKKSKKSKKKNKKKGKK